jgi:hypothetical protein
MGVVLTAVSRGFSSHFWKLEGMHGGTERGELGRVRVHATPHGALPRSSASVPGVIGVGMGVGVVGVGRSHAMGGWAH